MMRKLALVGLVVLVGRGSVAQIAAGSVLSFGFLGDATIVPFVSVSPAVRLFRH
jgi:hypothetical protein